MRKLSICLATHDDYSGIYFTIQAIRMYHAEVINDIEFVIVDNNPDSSHGKQLNKFVSFIKEPYQYIPFTEFKSTFVKGIAVDHARTPYVLYLDSHVFVVPGAIKKLIDFFDSGKDNGNFLQGPLLHDDLVTVSTHFDPVWKTHMYGVWGTDSRGTNSDNPPFEIPAQGMGLFACRKHNWVGFNRRFRGFGGEEFYIHEKYRKNKKVVLCLPFLRWMHRFGRPEGVTYPLSVENKVKNYFIGFEELGLDTASIYNHFINDCKMDAETIRRWHQEVKSQK